MAAKENINSGIPLIATPAKLHNQIVSLISKSSNIPLDIFEKSEIVREEHYCIPAYCFEYNGEAPFSYEEGKQETRQEKGFTSDGETITTIKEVKWHTERGNASVAGTLFTSGNKKMAPYINEMYSKTDHNKLVDFDYLDFPSDVITLDYDLPQLTAFNENVKPMVDELLKDEGRKALNGTSYEKSIPRGGQYGVTYTRDFKMSGSRIQKDITRVFLGLYGIVLKYGDREYTVWVNGEGDKIANEGMPEDSVRKSTLEQMQAKKSQALSSIEKPKPGLLNFGKWIGIIIGVMGVLSLLGGAGADALILLLPGLLLSIPCGMARSKKIKAYDEQHSNAESQHQREIDGFTAAEKNVKQQFESQKKAMRGIYEKVSGDPEAF
jgi:hypothetical protein